MRPVTISESDDAIRVLCDAMEPKIAHELEESRRYGFRIDPRTLCYLALQGLMSIGVYPYQIVRLNSPSTPEAKKPASPEPAGKAEAVPSENKAASAPLIGDGPKR